MPPIPNQVSIPAKPSSLLKVYDGGHKDFSWTTELKHIFSHKFFSIIWWPLFKYRQRHFTNSSTFQFCKTLPGFSNLWKGIQKGAFAYNSLFLQIKPYHRSSSVTNLADITTLALFFGDEFIDGICVTAGKISIRNLVKNNTERFCLTKNVKEGSVRLAYRFDLLSVLPAEVLDTVNPKYGISYKKFYELLQQFLLLINDHLAGFSFEKAQKTADKVIDVCNTCLRSYWHDVNSDLSESIQPFSSILQSHELKTRFMQKKLLELRCILTEKEHLMSSTQAQGWMDIMRVVQIYDDMQDVVEDDNFQDNLVLSAACNYFLNEWNWFHSQKDYLKNIDAHERALIISLFMPCSIHHCLQVAAEKIRVMNWEQQKIANYLLFKNWFIPCKNKNLRYLRDQNCKALLTEIFGMLNEKMGSAFSITAIKGFCIETCLLSGNAKKVLLKKADIETAYQLRYNLLLLSSEVKANIFDQLVKD